MADFPSNISPYQVAPPRGDAMMGLAEFIRQRFLTEQGMQQEAVAENTRQAINQQQGYGDIDPFAQQKFDVGATNNRINAGNYDMNRTTFDQGQEFTRNFIGAAQQNPEIANDPYSRLFIQSGNSPQAAQGLLGQVNNQSQMANQQSQLEAELANRKAMNTDDNTSNLQGIRDQFKLKTDLNTQEQQRILGAAQGYLQSGDLSGLIAAGVPTDQQMLLGEQRSQKQESEKAAAAQARLDADAEASRKRLLGGGAQGDGGVPLSPEQTTSVAQARVNQMFGKFENPEDRKHALARFAAGDPQADPTFRLSPDKVSSSEQQQMLQLGKDAFGEQFNTLYQQILQVRLQQMQQAQYQAELDRAKGKGVDPMAGGAGTGMY